MRGAERFDCIYGLEARLSQDIIPLVPKLAKESGAPASHPGRSRERAWLIAQKREVFWWFGESRAQIKAQPVAKVLGLSSRRSHRYPPLALPRTSAASVAVSRRNRRGCLVEATTNELLGPSKSLAPGCGPMGVSGM